MLDFERTFKIKGSFQFAYFSSYLHLKCFARKRDQNYKPHEVDQGYSKKFSWKTLK